jgi:O-acetyl-ADP-ribose deacetylase (regulator of RNase III)
MSIEYVHGDVLKAPVELVAHGVNCRGGFGKGIAGQIAKLYPQVREKYLEKHRTEGWKLGDVQYVEVSSKLTIINCATQDEYWNPGDPRKVYVNYDAIRSVMEKLLLYPACFNMTIGIPKIGAGLAGGDWTTIESIINEVFRHRIIQVYIQD